jgi:PEGA domain-containing protein
MTRSSQTLIAVLVAVGLGMPQLASAQGRAAPPGSSSSGTATDRPAPSSSGSSSGSSVGTAGSVGSNGGSSNGGGSSSDGRSGAPAVPSRDHSGRPTVGTAGSRVLGTVTGLPGPTFGPWGRYFPWYSTGFGWDYGFVQFNPYFGSTGLLWGPWYDPFYYDPFNPFGYGYNAFMYGRPYDSTIDRAGSAPVHVTGSIRLKVSPGTAEVYIDGVLAGVASEFDGLFGHHLVLERGPHQLELRADGYEAYHETISVDAGKTLTERLSLKKTK